MILNTSVLLNKKKIKLIKSNFKTTLKKNKVLVKILYSGVCRSQLMEIDMKRGKDKFLPHMFGHEAVGIVEKIGSNIKSTELTNKVLDDLFLGIQNFSGGFVQIVETTKKQFSSVKEIEESIKRIQETISYNEKLVDEVSNLSDLSEANGKDLKSVIEKLTDTTLAMKEKFES